MKLERVFDLIWCGSLFTHLDRDRWPAFLEFFSEHLAPDGLLVFTTHGLEADSVDARRRVQLRADPRRAAALVEGYARDGFGFVSPAGQAFGISLSSPCPSLPRTWNGSGR